MTSEQKLLHCFQTIFTGESDEKLKSATPDNLTKWDSTNHFILLQLVEEEFDLRIPEDEGGELLSFRDLQHYVEAHT
jgi:acyl carrier protein